MFSKTCEYGIRACIFISLNSKNKKRVNQKEIAEAIDSPIAFTAKILHALAKHKIIVSTKWPTGGFVITDEKLKQLKLIDIVDAIDGDAIYKTCGLGLTECDDSKPCPLHSKFKSIRSELKNMLNSTLILDLSDSLYNGKSFLKLTDLLK